jgi:hypothetical protein
MVRRLLLAAVGLFAVSGVVATARPADAACGHRATPARNLIGSVRAHHIERVQARGAGCAGVVATGGCQGTVVSRGAGCSGTLTVIPTAPVPMPPADTKK